MVQTANSACDSFWNHGPVPHNFPSTSPTWRCEQIWFDMDWNNETFRLPSGAKTGYGMVLAQYLDGTQSHSWFWGWMCIPPRPYGNLVGFDSSPTWQLHVDLQYLGGAWASQVDYSVRSETYHAGGQLLCHLGLPRMEASKIGRKSRQNYKQNHVKSQLLTVCQHMTVCQNPRYPCSSHQNSWFSWMFIPLKMVFS